MADLGRISTEVAEVFGVGDPHGRISTEVVEVYGVPAGYGRVGTGMAETFGTLAVDHGRVSSAVIEVFGFFPSGGPASILPGVEDEIHSELQGVIIHALQGWDGRYV